MPQPQPRFSVIASTPPIPSDLTHRQGLFALYALQEWECLRHPSDGPYKPGYFYNKTLGILRGLEAPSRQTALRHFLKGTCIACDAPVDVTRSKLDHMIARVREGPDDLWNALVFCRPCNSSKGTRDLLEWWLLKTYPVEALGREIVCLYTRALWQHHPDVVLDQPLPAPSAAFLVGRAAPLPSDAHRVALIGSAYAGCGLWRWLREETRHA